MKSYRIFVPNETLSGYNVDSVDMSFCMSFKNFELLVCIQIFSAISQKLFSDLETLFYLKLEQPIHKEENEITKNGNLQWGIFQPKPSRFSGYSRTIYNTNV